MDVMVKATLVPGGLVGVDDALTGHAINDGYCILVGSFGLGTVSTTDGLNHLFDVGTKLGTMIHVLLTTDFGLACALFCLDSVGQKDDSWGVRTEKVEYCADGTDLCLPIRYMHSNSHFGSGNFKIFNKLPKRDRFLTY